MPPMSRLFLRSSFLAFALAGVLAPDTALAQPAPAPTQPTPAQPTIVRPRTGDAVHHIGTSSSDEWTASSDG